VSARVRSAATHSGGGGSRLRQCILNNNGVCKLGDRCDRAADHSPSPRRVNTGGSSSKPSAKPTPKPRMRADSSTPVVCQVCGETGHIAYTCVHRSRRPDGTLLPLHVDNPTL